MSHDQSNVFFFFNDTATTEIYTLSLHDALPISRKGEMEGMTRAHLNAPSTAARPGMTGFFFSPGLNLLGDRKSTRLNSSHANISYAVFCLKKKKNNRY